MWSYNCFLSLDLQCNHSCLDSSIINNITYCLVVFRRFYSSNSPNQGFEFSASPLRGLALERDKPARASYRNKYELTIEQKDALIGICGKQQIRKHHIQKLGLFTPEKLESELNSLHSLYIKELYKDRIASVKPFDGKSIATCTDFLDKGLRSQFLKEWGSKSGIYLIEYKYDPSIYYIGRSSLLKNRLYDHFRANSINKFHLFLRLVGWEHFNVHIVEVCESSKLGAAPLGKIYTYKNTYLC